MPFQHSPQQLSQASPYLQQQQGYQHPQLQHYQPGFHLQQPAYEPQQQFYSAPYYVQQTQQPPTRSHLTETKYVLTRQGPLGSAGQATAAQNFFARSKQPQGVSSCLAGGLEMLLEQIRPSDTGLDQLLEQRTKRGQPFI